MQWDVKKMFKLLHFVYLKFPKMLTIIFKKLEICQISSMSMNFARGFICLRGDNKK